MELDNFNDTMDNSSRNVDFLNFKFGRIFVVFSITNSLNEDLDVCYVIDWKNVFPSLLSMKVTFKAIVYIYDQKSFNNLVMTFHEEDFMDDISLEYGFYQASKQEVFLSRLLGPWMNLPLLLYAYLYFSQERKSAHEDILASRSLLAWVPIYECPFPKEKRLYKLKLNLNAIWLIL